MKKQCGIPCARTERGKAFVKALFVPNLALLHCVGTVSLPGNRPYYLLAHAGYHQITFICTTKNPGARFIRAQLKCPFIVKHLPVNEFGDLCGTHSLPPVSNNSSENLMN